MYAIEGTPDASCVDAQGYAAILDVTIDKMMGLHDPASDPSTPPSQ